MRRCVVLNVVTLLIHYAVHMVRDDDSLKASQMTLEETNGEMYYCHGVLCLYIS